ncbi:protein SOSEKI 5-like [Nymphaea colorata]|nr:protein SOSEKI 5-like [Nymphaea colorata]
MAARARGGGRVLEMPARRSREASPERTKVWTEPRAPRQERRVPVLYYLCRNGQLEHPHFMEVPLSSVEGLYLRDVTSRLNFLRGKGIASMYSWSSKRSYKNGFVWHDLSENDFIYPINGHEYVLKGSEIVNTLPSSAKACSVPCSSREPRLVREFSPEGSSSSNERSGDSGPLSGRKTIDKREYKVYKAETPAEFSAKAADASTQTDDQRRRGRRENAAAASMELNADEVSPPPSTSSPSSGTDGKDQPDTLEAMMKDDSRVGSFRTVDGSPEELSVRMVNHARVRASAVLMQLISCGSVLVNRPRPQRDQKAGSPAGTGAGDLDCCLGENPGLAARVRLEEKEYFSGSLVETRRGQGVAEEIPRLQRSSSYNADRGDRTEVTEEEEEGVRAKCIPRKTTRSSGRKEGSAISRSAHGSKRITDEPAKRAAGE